MSELRVKRLQKSFFYGNQEKIIIQDLSIVFKKGLSYGLFGASGMGKSTLLHLLAGIERPTQGAIFCNKILIEKLDPAQRASFVSLILQKPFFFKQYSVFENCMLVSLIHKQPYYYASKQILFLLKQVGLFAYKDAVVGILSGGQQQRLSLVRSLLLNPAFILADELTAGMDAETAQNCMVLLKSICKEYEIGLIFSTHHTDLAFEMDYCFTLKDGILEQQK